MAGYSSFCCSKHNDREGCPVNDPKFYSNTWAPRALLSSHFVAIITSSAIYCLSFWDLVVRLLPISCLSTFSVCCFLVLCELSLGFVSIVVVYAPLESRLSHLPLYTTFHHVFNHLICISLFYEFYVPSPTAQFSPTAPGRTCWKQWKAGWDLVFAGLSMDTVWYRSFSEYGTCMYGVPGHAGQGEKHSSSPTSVQCNCAAVTLADTMKLSSFTPFLLWFVFFVFICDVLW